MRSRLLVMVVAVTGVAVLVGGCSSSASRVYRDRMRVAEAEAIDGRQRASTAEQQLKDAQVKYDRVNAEHQTAQAQLYSKQKQVESLSTRDKDK